MEDVKIEALDLKQGGKDARDLSRKMRVVVKVITGWWGGERNKEKWEMFERIEEVLRRDFGDGEVWVRSVALIVTARKPEQPSEARE